jgi:ketosteroid isomerase-like protein
MVILRVGDPPAHHLTGGAAAETDEKQHVQVGIALGREAAFLRRSGAQSSDTALAMSEEKVEKVRRGFAEYNSGDIDAALAEWAPDAVWDWSNSRGFDAGVFRGHAEIRAHWQRLLAAFDEVRVELVEPIEEVEEGLLVVENLGYLRGRDGIEVQTRSALLITIRDGQTASFTLYQTKQEALEAAGLSE